MLFSRVASFFLMMLSLGILTVAKPVELESRASTADLQNVVATLKSKTDQIVPQIKRPDTVTLLINELITAPNTAQNSVTKTQVRDLDDLEKRQNQQVVAQQFATVVQDIAGAFKLLPKGLPGLAGLLLLKGVSGLLAGLGFGLTLGFLGL